MSGNDAHVPVARDAAAVRETAQRLRLLEYLFAAHNDQRSLWDWEEHFRGLEGIERWTALQERQARIDELQRQLAEVGEQRERDLVAGAMAEQTAREMAEHEARVPAILAAGEERRLRREQEEREMEAQDELEEREIQAQDELDAELEEAREEARARGFANVADKTIKPEEVAAFDDEHAHCPICMEEVVAGEVVGELDCGHWFHRHCIQRWLEDSEQCPNCRAVHGCHQPLF